MGYLNYNGGKEIFVSNLELENFLDRRYPENFFIEDFYLAEFLKNPCIFLLKNLPVCIIVQVIKWLERLEYIFNTYPPPSSYFN